MKKVKLSTAGFGKKAKRQVVALLPMAATIIKIQAGMYIIKDKAGKIIADVDAVSTTWGPTINYGEKAVVCVR